MAVVAVTVAIASALVATERASVSVLMKARPTGASMAPWAIVIAIAAAAATLTRSQSGTQPITL